MLFCLFGRSWHRMLHDKREIVGEQRKTTTLRIPTSSGVCQMGIRNIELHNTEEKKNHVYIH